MRLPKGYRQYRDSEHERVQSFFGCALDVRSEDKDRAVAVLRSLPAVLTIARDPPASLDEECDPARPFQRLHVVGATEDAHTLRLLCVEALTDNGVDAWLV